MFICEIKCEGDTLNDIKDAIQESLKRIEAGNTSGFDKNETGEFHFLIQVEPKK